jgi:hypothetical protein
MACHDFTRRKALDTTPARESINKLMMWSTMQTTMMPGTIVNSRLWQSKQSFSFKKHMLHSISPQCNDAAAQSKQGAWGELW